MAQGFWAILISHGLQGGALSHINSREEEDDEEEEDDDDDMDGEEGWKEEYTQWWFEFLNEKGGKGISKDTWQMVGRVHLSGFSLALPDTAFSSLSSYVLLTVGSRSMTPKVRVSLMQ